MTEQEIFDTVARHLLTQKAKAKLEDREDDMCAYQTKEGLKCAVGCLIPEDVYSPSMETKAIRDLVNDYEPLGDLFAWHEDLLELLQHIHDDEDVSEWHEHLSHVALDYHLDTFVLLEFNS